MRALSRKNAPRKSLLRNLATSLVLYEKITTTTAKAKEVKPLVEHLINQAKSNDLNARRRLLSVFFDENATKKVLEVLVPRYKDQKSGFVKIYKLGARLGDGAEQSVLEFKKVKIELPKTEEKPSSAKAVEGKEEKKDNSPVGEKTKVKNGSKENKSK